MAPVHDGICGDMATSHPRRNQTASASSQAHSNTLKSQVGKKLIGFVPDASKEEEQQPRQVGQMAQRRAKRAGMLVNGLEEQ